MISVYPGRPTLFLVYLRGIRCAIWSHFTSNGRRIPVPHSRVYRGRGLKAGGSKSTFGDKGDECPGLRRWVEFSPTSPTSGAEPLHSLARSSHSSANKYKISWIPIPVLEVPPPRARSRSSGCYQSGDQQRKRQTTFPDL